MTTTLTGPYTRRADQDRRIGRGDDWAGDAWQDDPTGVVFWVAVGQTPTGPRRYPRPTGGPGATKPAQGMVDDL